MAADGSAVFASQGGQDSAVLRVVGVPVAHSEASEQGTGGRLRFQALGEWQRDTWAWLGQKD